MIKFKSKKIFIDMDNVLVNFASSYSKLSPTILSKYPEKDLDEVPGIFSKMEPMKGAVEAVKKLSEKFDV